MAFINTFDRFTTERIGREYLRVSYDRSGRERSPGEQHKENVTAAGNIGVTLGASYREAKAISASRYSDKVRDDFARLLADLGSGQFNADVLVLWESSRGSRKVSEWVELIDVCERQGVSIFVTTHGREYHPGNARDRRSLLEDAVDSEYESAKGSARGVRAAAANAVEGKPHGRIAFGYQRRYDERTRVMIAQEPHEEEAPVILELFKRLEEGHSFKSSARDFEARGITNDSGLPFSPQHLRNMARNATYSGVRVHRPKKKPATARADGTPAPSVSQAEATWPAIVSRETFLHVERMLSDPKRRTTRPGRAKHLLSMIARCDVCDAVLCVTLKYRPDGDYWCAKAGHVKCSKDKLDAYAEAAIIGYLSDPELYAKLNTNEKESSAELAQVRTQLAEARTELAELRAAVAAGQLKVASLIATEPGIEATITRLETFEDELSTPSELRALLQPGEDVAQRWEKAPVSTRRAVARLLLTPEVLGQLRLMRCPPGRRPQPAERARWIRTAA
jgi:site-specific DNA recombinase